MNSDSRSESSKRTIPQLPKNDAIRVFSRWISEFELHGPSKEIQNRVLESGYTSGEEAVTLISKRRNERFYSIHGFDKLTPIIYFEDFPDLEEIKDSHKDVAIVTEDFEECLVVNHEDGYFWDGPTYLKKIKPNKSAHTTPAIASR